MFGWKCCTPRLSAAAVASLPTRHSWSVPAPPLTVTARNATLRRCAGSDLHPRRSHRVEVLPELLLYHLVNTPVGEKRIAASATGHTNLRATTILAELLPHASSLDVLREKETAMTGLKMWTACLTAFLFVQSITTSAGALAKAQTIWGADARVKRASRNVYQVGCFIKGKFIVVGQGASWDAAFAAVPMSRNGPRTLTATARDRDGLTAQAAPVSFYVCNP